MASETLAVTVAVLFVLTARAGNGLLMMISDKINQWTLLVGMLPLAISIGAGAASALPLDARRSDEFFLTDAQSLFGIALLLRLRLSVAAALALLGLFAVQVGVAFIYRNDEAQTIASLTMLGWIYLGLTAVLALLSWRQLLSIVRVAFTTPGDSPAPAPLRSKQ